MYQYSSQLDVASKCAKDVHPVWYPTIYHFDNSYMDGDGAETYDRPLFDTVYDAYQKSYNRGWDKVYWMIDLHGTLLVPSYMTMQEQQHVQCYDKFYSHAREFLAFLLSLPETRIILWSCLTQTELESFKYEKFTSFGLAPDRVFLNKNPLEKSNDLSCFDEKPYFSLLLDDKAGFNPQYDFFTCANAINSIRNGDIAKHFNG